MISDATLGYLSAATIASKPAQLRLQDYKKNMQALSRYRGIIEQMLAEPMVMDDQFRAQGVESIMAHLVQNSEVFLCMVGNDVCAIAVLDRMIPGREADFIGWVHPDYRVGNHAKQKMLADFVIEVFTHAFQDLGLVKLTSKVALENTGALRFLQNIGFRAIGQLSYDFQYGGNLFDSVLFEQISPAAAGIVSSDGLQNSETQFTDGHGDHVEPDTDHLAASGHGRGGEDPADLERAASSEPGHDDGGQPPAGFEDYLGQSGFF